MLCGFSLYFVNFFQLLYHGNSNLFLGLILHVLISSLVFFRSIYSHLFKRHFLLLYCLLHLLMPLPRIDIIPCHFLNVLYHKLSNISSKSFRILDASTLTNSLDLSLEILLLYCFPSASSFFIQQFFVLHYFLHFSLVFVGCHQPMLQLPRDCFQVFKILSVVYSNQQKFDFSNITA